MTKKMTTSNANITGASGEKAAVSDFNSSLSFQPGGNISGVLTLRTVFPQYKDSVSIREEIEQSPQLSAIFHSWTPSRQQEFLDFNVHYTSVSCFHDYVHDDQGVVST